MTAKLATYYLTKSKKIQLFAKTKHFMFQQLQNCLTKHLNSLFIFIKKSDKQIIYQFSKLKNS